MTQVDPMKIIVRIRERSTDRDVDFLYLVVVRDRQTYKQIGWIRFFAHLILGRSRYRDRQTDGYAVKRYAELYADSQEDRQIDK